MALNIEEFIFKDAEKSELKVKIAIFGPSGSGKTEGALKVASGLGDSIFFIDTEDKSALYFTGRVPKKFKHINLKAPYHVDRGIGAINAAVKAGADVIILDSYSHFWSGEGGINSENDRIAIARFQGNTWSARSVTKPMHTALLETIKQCPVHVIVCMRAEVETAQIKGDNGKVKVVKLAMKPEQHKDILYDFAVSFLLDVENHFYTIDKNRTPLFVDDYGRHLSQETGATILQWAQSGTPIEYEQEEVDAINLQLEGCKTVEKLREEFAKAWKAATSAGATLSADKIKARYEACKAKLTTPAPTEEQPAEPQQ